MKNSYWYVGNNTKIERFLAYGEVPQTELWRAIRFSNFLYKIKVRGTANGKFSLYNYIIDVIKNYHRFYHQ